MLPDLQGDHKGRCREQGMAFTPTHTLGLVQNAVPDPAEHKLYNHNQTWSFIQSVLWDRSLGHLSFQISPGDLNAVLAKAETTLEQIQDE